MPSYDNPFQTIDVNIPEQFRAYFTQYCRSKTEGRPSDPDLSPFRRNVDLWFLAFCVAVKLKLKPYTSKEEKTYKAIEGTVFSSDPWRIKMMMLTAMVISNDKEILLHPREMFNLINGYAIAGIPYVIDMLKSGEDVPIGNLSDEVESLIKKIGN